MRWRLAFSLACLTASGCTQIRWYSPEAGPDSKPIFSYTSGKDIAADGFLVQIDYDGENVKSIHVEIGHASGAASPVWDQANEMVESAVKGVVEGLKITHGVP